jgi:hypothetical protein
LLINFRSAKKTLVADFVAEVGDYDDERMDTIFDALSYFAPFGSENTPMDLH